MVWLCLGVLLFWVVHFIPSVGQGLRKALIGRVGEDPYKGIIAVALLTAVVLMVIGWRSTVPQAVYLAPAWGTWATAVLMLVSIWLFGAPYQPMRIRRYLRHPQLTGMALWSLSHLVSNGDSRSLVLFGGLGLWALVEMPLINRREGDWTKPDTPALSVEIRGVLIGVVIFVALMYLHPYFTGVSAIPR